MIPAQLKILKVLVEELLSASGNARNLDAEAAAELGEDGSADGDWEDDPNDFLDLGLGATKEQLMAFDNDGPSAFSRGRDDETQAYLLNFFRDASSKPGFAEAFNSLSQDEQEKLRSMS